MAEVAFYHLTRTPAAEALPLLLGRTLAAGRRAVVVCPDESAVSALDDALWECRDPAWLPHGTARDGDAELQPIWLATTDEAPNGATFLFTVDGAAAAAIERFERVFDLFDGGDPARVEAARARWRAAKAGGHTLTYWQQGARGWERKG